jgi:hypothetical protein
MAGSHGLQMMSMLIPGTEDPSAVVAAGRVSLEWEEADGFLCRIRTFEEIHPPRVVRQDLRLPTLYLHFLDKAFFLEEQEVCTAKRAGNDNSEIQIAVPLSMLESCAQRDSAVRTVTKFLKRFGAIPTGNVMERSGGFSPERNYKACARGAKLCFDLKVARPKAEVNIDKSKFGIPQRADLYMFAQNHSSILFATDEEKEAFGESILLLSEGNPTEKKLSVFLKVFFEGGFAYNERIPLGASSYMPKNVGVAAMSVVPAFEGQSGISTGYPYKVPAGHLLFIDTVPVTINAIANMSPLHKRYGLSFTRCVDFIRVPGTEHATFMNIAPFGGFFYVPETPGEYEEKGCLLYAFGESEESATALEAAMELGDVGATRPQSSSREPVPQTRVCTICLDQTATVATVPCGHLAFCASCPTLTTCPVCRRAVSSTQRIFV